jgi:hypothetical protein
MLGPALFRLDRPSCPGSAGPTESSLSLSSSMVCFIVALGEIFVDLTGDLGTPLVIEARLLCAGSDCCAFWSVDGSYQPSASSPRFLTQVSLIF